MSVLDFSTKVVLTENLNIIENCISAHRNCSGCPKRIDLSYRLYKFVFNFTTLFHRFCAECIVTALRSGNKECPTCRKKLVSKRSLRPDPNFDQLVEKIFPNREEYEAHQESILDSISRSHSQNFITSIKGKQKNCLISLVTNTFFRKDTSRKKIAQFQGNQF